MPSGQEKHKLIPNFDEKAAEEVNKYIHDLSKTNPQLAHLIQDLWSDIQDNLEQYRDENISVLLENMIQSTRYEQVEDFANKWCVNDYNPNRKRQIGETELKNTSNYNKYKEISPQPVSKLKYWKTIREDLEELMNDEILPLRKK